MPANALVGPRPLRVLDLFAGLKGWSQSFADRGHYVYTVEIDPAFEPDWVVDIHDVDAFTLQARMGGYPDPFKWGRPDIILASPPCQGFSVMNIGKNWTHEHQPKTETAKEAIRLVEKTLELISDLRPRYFVIENPRAKLRKMPQMENLERRTVTYCKYGEKRMKPTDLWGGFPPSLRLHPPCKNGAPCHIRAPRGSTTGSQGMKSAASAKIPYPLSLAVCKAAERDVPR